MQARSAREPAVLFLDDAHWIDSGSDAFLAQIVEALRDSRTLLLVNFRPEYHADWMGKSEYQQLPLRPLGPEEIEELLRDLMGSGPSVATLPRLIRERTAGNPFFIEEVVQSLVELGSLEGVRGAYQLVKAVESLEVPTTVQPLLAARIDRLPEREKRLLQSASVLGKDFSETLLKRVVDLPDSELAEALSHLQRGEFIVEQSLYPEVEYAFRHPLTQSVALDSQLSERRQRAHARAAQAFEELHADRADAQAGLIAHHWERAGQPIVAAGWHRRAADAANYSGYSSTALRHWKDVLRLALSASASPEGDALTLGACRGIIEQALTVRVPSDEVHHAFEVGITIAERAEDARSHALLLDRYAGWMTLSGGDPRRGREYARMAASLAEQSGDAALSARLAGEVARSDLNLMRFREALATAERNLALVLDSADTFHHVWMLGYVRGESLCGLGELDAALDQHSSQIEIARASGGERFGTGGSLAGRARVYNWKGEMANARADALQAREAGEKLTIPLLVAWSEHMLGEAYLLEGNWPVAIETLERSLALARESATYTVQVPAVVAALSLAHLGERNLSRAREFAEEAAGGTGWFLEDLVWARVLIQADGADSIATIRTRLDRARDWAGREGARPFAARICETYADLGRLVGDEAEAGHQLREAHRLYTEMGATGHAERVARELEEPRSR